jgi:hypothetical protein
VNILEIAQLIGAIVIVGGLLITGITLLRAFWKTVRNRDYEPPILYSALARGLCDYGKRYENEGKHYIPVMTGIVMTFISLWMILRAIFIILNEVI